MAGGIAGPIAAFLAIEKTVLMWDLKRRRIVRLLCEALSRTPLKYQTFLEIHCDQLRPPDLNRFVIKAVKSALKLLHIGELCSRSEACVGVSYI